MRRTRRPVTDPPCRMPRSATPATAPSTTDRLGLRAHVVPAHDAQPVADLVSNALGHRGRSARLLPIRCIHHAWGCEMIKREIFRAATAGAEPARAQHPGDTRQSGDV